MNFQSITKESHLTIWPEQQEGEFLSRDPSIILTHFDDVDAYHDNLIETVLKLEENESTHKTISGSTKVRDMEKWGTPESDFICDRAVTFFKETSGREDVEISESWASIYRAGDYLSPHGHPNVSGTITYCLDTGNPDEESNLFSGQFMFADPRIEFCCPDEEQCVSRTLTPHFKPGSMILFPGTLIHFVHLYNGSRPRITLTWNFK